MGISGINSAAGINAIEAPEHEATPVPRHCEQNGVSAFHEAAPVDHAEQPFDLFRALGELFSGLEPSLRRPVEIFGLLHLAAGRDWGSEEDLEAYEAVRPDGSRRAFAVPRTRLPDPDRPERPERPESDTRA